MQIQCVLNGVTIQVDESLIVHNRFECFLLTVIVLNDLLLHVDRLCVFVQTVTCHSILSCSNLNSCNKSLIVPNLFECFLLTVRVFHCFCTGFVCLYRFCVFVQTATCHSVSRCCNLNSSLSTKTSGVHTDKSQAGSLMCPLLCVRRLVGWLSACLLAS